MSTYYISVWHNIFTSFILCRSSNMSQQLSKTMIRTKLTLDSTRRMTPVYRWIVTILPLLHIVTVIITTIIMDLVPITQYWWVHIHLSITEFKDIREVPLRWKPVSNKCMPTTEMTLHDQVDHKSFTEKKAIIPYLVNVIFL